MELAFVLARRQNHFFVEIVDAIRGELDALGVASTVHRDGFPEERPDRVYVLVPPHEWFALDGARHRPTRAQLKRTVFICAEQPGTSFFDDDVALAPLAGAVLDVSTGSVTEFERRGIKGVGHFPLGWTPSWSHVPVDDGGSPELDPAGRDIDVLHLGIFSPKRATAIAAAGFPLSHWRCQLILSDADAPNSEQQQNFAIEQVKWDLLRRAKVLLNIHVADRPYFEWQRIVQAVSNGCAVVSEHSVGIEPLRAGEHLLVGRPEVLGLLSHGLLSDDAERQRVAREAYVYLRDELPFRRSVERLVGAAETVLGDPTDASTAAPWPHLTSPAAPATKQPEVTRFPSVTEDIDASVLRAGLKDLRLELMDMKREFARLGSELRDRRPPPLVELDRETRAWKAARPRVSVIVPLYNYENHVAHALESVASSRYRDVEVVVVDDGSSDGSLAAARRFLSSHEGLPARIVRHPVNRGLGRTRNTGVAFARGELAFMLDADNMLYRHGLARLVDALDADPEAAFAYGILAMHSDTGPVGLRSYYPWRPERLRTGNYIDAMALWRLDVLRRLRGYAVDKRLHGWEDYDLWCRAADAGNHGGFVPEVIARYRVTQHSMLSVTNISAQTAVSLLIERSPRLFAGVEPPL
jgi:hypothetical protein